MSDRSPSHPWMLWGICGENRGVAPRPSRARPNARCHLCPHPTPTHVPPEPTSGVGRGARRARALARECHGLSRTDARQHAAGSSRRRPTPVESPESMAHVARESRARRRRPGRRRSGRAGAPSTSRNMSGSSKKWQREAAAGEAETSRTGLVLNRPTSRRYAANDCTAAK